MNADKVAILVMKIIIAAAVVVYIIRIQKAKEQKRLSSFCSKAQAIATDIACRFNESEAGMRGSVENLMNKCRCKPDEVRSDALAAYNKKDYLLFAYLSALEYARQFDTVSVEELNAFCESRIKQLRVRLVRTPEYEIEQ